MNMNRFLCLLNCRFPGALSLAVAIVLSLSGSTRAELVERSDADRVAQNWTEVMNQSEKSSNFTIGRVDAVIDEGRTLGWAYVLEPSGYIVVPRLRQLPPIKMYSTTSSIDLSAEDGPGALIRQVLSDRAAWFEARFGSLEVAPGDNRFAPANREWNRLSSDPIVFATDSVEKLSGTREEAGPLITTVWDQGEPYNDWCPMGDGGQCVVGCVATAFAQIMAYHQWPPAGEGEYSYDWNGDQSCGGSTPGRTLTADFSDAYNWDNIIEHCYFGCEPETVSAIAELCYEVGVACEMNYGSCASGAWPARMVTMMPAHFRYKDSVSEIFRSDHTLEGWFGEIQQQIDLGLPTQYTIYSHAIACDGYRIDGELLQYHMNYGWADGHNAWYVLDNLYCPWEGCDPTIEHMIIDMKPDRDLVINADTTWGWTPLTVQFDGSSELEVYEWHWQFGDGDSSMQQSPLHVYDQPGLYDLSVNIQTDQGTRSENRVDYIAVLADSMAADTVEAVPGDTIEVTIRGRTTLPLKSVRIPVEYGGDLDIELVGWSTEGCRSDSFQFKQSSHWDPMNSRATLRLYNTDGGASMPAGNGPVIRLLFALPTAPLAGQVVDISIDGYFDRRPYFESERGSFVAPVINGRVTYQVCCVGIRGNVDGDPYESVDIGDLVAMVSYMFDSGSSLPCATEADVDGSGSVEITDLIYLVSYMFDSGPDPEPCP